MTKQDFIHSIRQFIADGKTDEALDLLRARINDYDTSLVTDATMLESRFNTTYNDFTVRSILPREEYDRTVAQINYALLEIVEKLEKSATINTGTAKNKNSGRILHNIPGTMPIGVERRCIVRIAYDDESLLRDLETDENTTIQSVRIAEVMGVELLDDNETPAFSIRTITDEEQCIVCDDYTQWLFKVKALREGKFPLTLKVSVIEEINGKERKRDIVLEKEVFIISQLEPEPAPAAPVLVKSAEATPQETGFEDSAYRINYVSSQETRAMASASPTPKRFSISSIASTIAVIAVALTGWVAFQKFSAPTSFPVITSTDDEKNKNNNKSPISSSKEDTTLKLAPNEITKDNLNTQLADSGNKNKTSNISEPKEMSGGVIVGSKSSDEPAASYKTPEVSTAHKSPEIHAFPNTKTGKANKSVPAVKNTKRQKIKKADDVKPKNNPDATTISTMDTAKTQPKIKIGDLNLSTSTSEVISKGGTEPEAEVKTYKVRLILRGEMKKAQISVDGQSVDQYLKKNIWGTPQYIEFKSSKTRHTITFKNGNVSCSVTDVLIENGDMSVEPCSFEK